MTIALAITDRNLTELASSLKKQLPDTDIICWPEIERFEQAEFVVCWRQPDSVWQHLPNVKVICSLGAGVDGLIGDKERPVHVPITRIVDQSLSSQMADFVLAQVLNHKCRLAEYQQEQTRQQWCYLPRHNSKTKVAVLGLGEIGLFVAGRMMAAGFKLSGWSRTKKSGQPFSCYAGVDALHEVVSRVDFVVSVLPATKETDNLFSSQFFDSMNSGAVFINVGRGNSVDEQALALALTEGKIAGAVLDVFKNEPLPENDPLWQVPNLTITPHIAAITEPKEVIKQIVENYRAMKTGLALKHQVDLANGY